MEEGEVKKWGLRFEIIARRAIFRERAPGPRARSLAQRSPKMSLGALFSGAFRTLRTRFRHWEWLETWALTEDILPPPFTETVLLEFFRFLYRGGRGPSVIPSAKQAIGARCPDLDSAQMLQT